MTEMITGLAEMTDVIAHDRVLYVLRDGRMLSQPAYSWQQSPWMGDCFRVDWRPRSADAELLPVLRSIARRVDTILPGATCYVVPDFDCFVDGGKLSPTLGVYSRDTREIVLSAAAGRGSSPLLSTALHECWHGVELTLSLEDAALIQTAGRRRGFSMRGYYASDSERAAEAFAGYASAVLLLNKNPQPRRPLSRRTPEHVFHEVLCGVYGKQSLAQLIAGDLRWLSDRLCDLLGI